MAAQVTGMNKALVEFEKISKDNSSDLVGFHEPNGQFVMINEACIRLTGYNQKDFIGKSPFDFYHPDDQDYIRKTGRHPSQDGISSVIGTYRFKRKDGSYAWFSTRNIPAKDYRGYVTKLITITRDVTAMVELKDRLTQSETLFTEAAKMAQIGMWAIDIDTKESTWSKEMYDILEVDHAYTANLDDCFEFFTDDTRTLIRNAYNQAADDGVGYDLIASIVTGRGKKIQVRVIGKPDIQRGRISKVYNVIQNIDKQIESNLVLQSMVQQLTNQNTLLEEINHILSHNVRSPIASMGMLLTIFNEVSDEAEKKKIFNQMVVTSQSLTESLNELLDISKSISTSEIKVTENDLGEIITNTIELLKGEILNNKAVINVKLDGWNKIPYPKVYLESIILNLMSNALKYRQDDKDPVINISTSVVNNYRTLTFGDNGCGMDMEKVGKDIFKLYKTFNVKKPGKGYGLFMTKRQIEAMGGKIVVDSKPDTGTTFTIQFNEINS